jgi:AAA ATPase domain
MAQARNPYIAGNPVGGSAAFVGRDDVLRAVQRVLGDPQHHGIVLYGQRRIGKTSILKHLAAWLPKNGGPRAIYFDLQDKASRPVGAILVDLAGKMAAAMDLPDPEPRGDAEVWFRDTSLPPVLDELPDGESLVVLLDEFDVLADAESAKAASASFFGYLRELLEKVAPSCGWCS